jgi:EAL domain-containing protein (putative c-di-GMP-specific phosphodiesterase class I)
LLRPALGPGNPAATPQEFVTLVEAVGLARELDLAVLREGVRMLRRSEASIAVNVSGLSIVDPLFVGRFLDEAARAPPGRLLIEVTETAEIDSLPAAAVQIERIRAAGVPVCLDDFGAGGASFRYIRDLRVDFVKIDGSYVRPSGRSDQGRSFVRAMCDLARSAKATTVAEMIETEAEAALMRDLGVVLGQGWLFGKPGEIPSAVPDLSPAIEPAGGSSPRVDPEYAERFRFAGADAKARPAIASGRIRP